MPPKTDSELLAAVVSNAPIILFAFDADGVFTLCEGRGLDALGKKPGESVGQSVFEMYKDNPKLLDCCRRALKGETVTAIIPVGPLAFETRCVPQLDWGGRVTGVLAVATDVTDAYRNSLAKDEFLSVISHELRSPLSNASGWAYMLRDEKLDAAETEKALEIICRNLDDLRRLIQELRDASQAATGVLRLNVKPCDLGAAVREAAETLEPAAAAKDLGFDVAAGALRGAADKARVRQIAWILLSNAVKFSPKGGRVSAALTREGDEAVLTVRDQGPGLAPELRGQVFDLARMPAAERTPRGRGLGLGLPIARRLAELHGGCVEVLDERERGAAFRARLPLSPKKGRKRGP